MVEDSVSIPFKRESGSKEIEDDVTVVVSAEVSIPFKRESGSKVEEEEAGSAGFFGVSIPFKRESGSKVGIGVLITMIGQEFQFPSNGKADPKQGDGQIDYDHFFVSIPFKRESGSKVLSILAFFAAFLACFNSLQTGKRIQSENETENENAVEEFQFPSNGKADPKVYLYDLDLLKGKRVFQFPSNGKADPKLIRRQQ